MIKKLTIKAIQFQIDHNGFPNGLPDKLTVKAFAPLYNHLHGVLEVRDNAGGVVEELCHWMAYLRDKIREYDNQYLTTPDEELDKAIKEFVDEPLKELKIK